MKKSTIPSPGGGISGKPLMPYSLWACEEIKNAWGSRVTVIGGGGVTCPEDVRAFKRAGADHVAIASALLNPFWRKSRVKALVEAART